MNAVRFYSLLFVSLVAAVATACSNGKKPDVATDDTATTAPVAADDHKGGHIKIPSNEPRFLNPVLETRFNRATPLIFEGLVGLDANLAPIPRLAESWKTSPDGKTITFKLQKGVTWHDGAPFTAKDVAFTFEAVRTTESQTLWKAYLSSVESLETPDDSTVIVKYSHAYAPALITWTLGIMPAHVFKDGDITDEEANREPVGTGPYRLQRWEAGKRMLLQANESWWYKKGTQIETVELIFDADKTITAMSAGELDFGEIDDIGDWSSEAQQPSFIERFEVSNQVESRFRVIAWNLDRKPYNDPRVRLALTHALNRSRVIDDVFLGQAQAISAPFFPNMFGADRSTAPHRFDLDRAVKLLDESGHPSKNGKRFRLDMIVLESLRGPTTEEMLGIFRRDLGAIGVKLNVSFVTTKDFVQKVVERDFDAAHFGWLADIPDPDPYSLLHSSMIKVGPNYAGYKNPEVDRLLEDARNTLDRDQRKAKYEEIHRILHDELPYTPLFAPYSHYAWNRRLRGVNPADIGSQPRFPGIANWWLAKEPAAKLK